MQNTLSTQPMELKPSLLTSLIRDSFTGYRKTIKKDYFSTFIDGDHFLLTLLINQLRLDDKNKNIRTVIETLKNNESDFIGTQSVSRSTLRELKNVFQNMDEQDASNLYADYRKATLLPIAYSNITTVSKYTIVGSTVLGLAALVTSAPLLPIILPILAAIAVFSIVGLIAGYAIKLFDKKHGNEKFEKIVAERAKTQGVAPAPENSVDTSTSVGNIIDLLNSSTTNKCTTSDVKLETKRSISRRHSEPSLHADTSHIDYQNLKDTPLPKVILVKPVVTNSRASSGASLSGSIKSSNSASNDDIAL